MPLIADDDVVEEFAAHAADRVLGDAVLPRAAERRPRRLDAEGRLRMSSPRDGEDAGPGALRLAVLDGPYFALEVEALIARCFKASAIAFSARGFKIA